MGYKFNKKEHLHELDGKPLMGVTSVLQIIAKPQLIQWAANMACDYINNYWKKGLPILDEDWDLLIKEARTAHRKKKEAAGEAGTDVHAQVEILIKEAIGANGGKLKEGTFSTNPSVQNFITWAIGNNVKFLESEKNIYSKELWIGGIVDMVFEMGGQKYIGDIKTSSAIYNEAFFQMAAYELCLQEMGEKEIAGYIVINLKKDGTMDSKMAVDRDLNKDAFKHALGLYKIIKSLEK